MINLDLIREKTCGNWPYILAKSGVPEKFLRNIHQSCPMCGGRDRFRFDNKEGRGTYYCNKCGAGDGFKFLKLFHGWSFPYTLKKIESVLGLDQSHNVNIGKYNDSAKRQRLITTWRAAKPVIIGDAVDCYLKTRGIALKSFPACLRHHSKLSYFDENQRLVGTFAAMLALVTDQDNKGITIHRTYLGKACKANVSSPKKLMSPVKNISGCSIKLFAPLDNLIAVAEGIETSLSFALATNIPTWATVSANGMEKVILPSSLTNVIVLADNDQSGVGQNAALNLSKRLVDEGRSVTVLTPPKIDTDFADFFKEVAI